MTKRHFEKLPFDTDMVEAVLRAVCGSLGETALPDNFS